MGLLSSVKGLWRFDGDTEPVQLSRRSFFFVGGVVAAGAVLPDWLAVAAPTGGMFGQDPLMDAALFRFYAGGRQGGATLMGYRLEREQYLLRIRKHMELYRGQQFAFGLPNEEWGPGRHG